MQKRYYLISIMALIFVNGIKVAEANVTSGGRVSVVQDKKDIVTGGEISLQQLIEYAYKHNPSLKSAKMKWAAVIERSPQVIAYKDPVLQYSYFIENIETRVGPQEHKVSVSQEIPFPGKLSIEEEVVNEEVKIARLEFERQTRDLIVELKDAYYELCYITDAIELTRQNKELLEQLTHIATTEYSMDGTTLHDVLQAQSQLAQVSYDLILLTELKNSEHTRINSLLNRPPEAPIGNPKKLNYQTFLYSLEDIYKLALANRHELKISESDVVRWSKKIDLAEKEYWPDFKLGVDYFVIGPAGNPNVSDSGQDAYAVNVGITIPLWFDKNRASVNEAKYEYDAAVYNKQELENRTFSEIKTLYFKLQNSNRLVNLYRNSLIPQAAESMEKSESWFKSKKGSFSGVLETRAVWLNFNLASQRALADYYQRIVQMEKLIGTSLKMGGTDNRGAR